MGVVLFAVLLSAALIGCRSDSGLEHSAEGWLSLEDFLKDPTTRIGAVGFGEADDRILSRVVDAQLSPVDTTLWVVDNVAPYVRHFATDGRQIKRFVSRGSGPLEAEAVGSLAVNDSIIAIAHSGMVSLYRHDGSPFATHVRLPVRAERIGTGCDGEWLISGRSASHELIGAQAGIFAARISPEGTFVRLIKADTGMTTIHGPRRFHSMPGSVTVFDIRSEPRVFASLSCPEYRWSTLAEAPPENITETWSGTQTHRTITIRYAKDGKRVTGFARFANATVVSFLAARGSNIAILSDNGDSIYAAVPGLQEVLDIRHGIAALGANEPVPGVVLVSAADLVNAVRAK